MKVDLPSPRQILEELADKAARQIDRLAPVAFDGALGELVRYHRFLLSLNSSRTPDGKPFSYAELAGNSWDAPHQTWIRPYIRLFERAAHRIPDDGHFLRALSHVASDLISSSEKDGISPGVIRPIVDLQILLMHRLETWVTKRTTVETNIGESAEPRLRLAGSDAKSYANVLTDIVGAWESLLQDAPALYHWPDRHDVPTKEGWERFRSSWPFVWQHLQNTAYCVAVAVWNEDRDGAEMFCDALLRWNKTLEFRLEDYSDAGRGHFLYPRILECDWEDASERAMKLSYYHALPPTPGQIVKVVLDQVHEDALLLTALLFLFWTINGKQSTRIGSQISSVLLNKEPNEATSEFSSGAPSSFRSLFVRLIRLVVGSEGFINGGRYSSLADEFVATLDNMTERRVVPGRVFTPSTIHGTDDLVIAKLSLLVARVPDEGDNGVVESIRALARDDYQYLNGDRSLRDVLAELKRYLALLSEPSAKILEGAALLNPTKNIQGAVGRVAGIVKSSAEVIESIRLERLKSSPIDAKKIEVLRLAIEQEVIHPAIPFFQNFKVETVPHQPAVEQYSVVINGLAKAGFITPAMEQESSGIIESHAQAVGQRAGQRIWRLFAGLPRDRIDVRSEEDEDTFFHELRELAKRVEPAPTLVVSRNTERRIRNQFLYRKKDGGKLEVETRLRATTGASYICTIEGIDIYGADFEKGTAWLFSSKMLKAVHYSTVDGSSECVTLAYEPVDDTNGRLRAAFYQSAEWVDAPIWELWLRSKD